jgi:hypothetical protein
LERSIGEFESSLRRDWVEFGFERFYQVKQLGSLFCPHFHKCDTKGVTSHPSHLSFIDSEGPIKTWSIDPTLKRRTNDDRYVSFDSASAGG